MRVFDGVLIKDDTVDRYNARLVGGPSNIYEQHGRAE